jgi:hypothetical protein
VGSVIVIVCWFVLATIVGAAAGGRGRSRFGWFVLALILSPLAGVLLAILPDLRTHEMPKEIATNATVKLDDDRELMRGAKHGAGWHP